MSDLQVNFAGLKLHNPLIAAAGPITGNIDIVKKLYDAGIGAVVTKTSFIKREYERWVGRKNIFPYKPVYKYQGLADGRLLSLPSQSDVPMEEFAKRITEMKKLGVTVIASAIGLSVKGYRECVRMLEDAGADAIELNFCCPIPEFTSLYTHAGDAVSMNPKLYAKLIKVVKRTVSVPVGIKSTVNLLLYAKVFEGLLRAKIANSYPDFITLVGQLDQNPGIDINTLEPIIPHISTFGWQGSLSKLTYSAVSTFSSSLGTDNPHIAASGGINTVEEVVTAMALGSTAAQLHTVILDKGPGVVAKILEELKAYLDSHGYSSVNDIIGKTSRNYIPSLLIGRFMRERDSLLGTVYAGVDGERCNGCSICERVCTENAVIMQDKKAVIEWDKCRGCNLCVLKCPRGAIRLENYNKLEEMIEQFKFSAAATSFREFMKKEKIGLGDVIALPGKLKRWGLR
ncbi:MAG: 4Fe-4S binding protein [Spirochaetes bacterium]|nr:4Fe-4S binding protein [Spirochaetota bacterium]